MPRSCPCCGGYIDSNFAFGGTVPPRMCDCSPDCPYKNPERHCKYIKGATPNQS